MIDVVTKIKLLPCPYCGHDVAEVTTMQELEECENFENEDICPACKFDEMCRYIKVVCNVNRGGCGASTGYAGNRLRAIEKWNRRNSLVSPQPCEDCISRQAYIERYRQWGYAEVGRKIDNEALAIRVAMSLPPVTPQPKTGWIPVSERLPKDRDWYLGIFKEPDTGWINSLPFICDYVGKETKATTKEYWILRGFTDRENRDCDYYFNLECVAWMPLPEPYKAESEPQESEDKE